MRINRAQMRIRGGSLAECFLSSGVIYEAEVELTLE